MPDILEAHFASEYDGHRVVETRHGRVVCTDSGTGPTIVLVHGIPLSLITWRKVRPRLASRFRTIALDMLGFGLSEKPRIEYDMPVLTETVTDVCATLGVGRAAFVGHSFGAAVVLKLAEANPGLVDRMVLINSPSYPGGAHALEVHIRKSLVRMLAVTPWEGLKLRAFASRLEQSYLDVSRQEPRLARAYYQLLTRDGGERSYLSTLGHFDETQFATSIPKAAHRALLLFGESDRMLPLANALRMAREMPSSQLITLACTAHMPQEEEPEQVTRWIEAFMLDRVSPAHQEVA